METSYIIIALCLIGCLGNQLYYYRIMFDWLSSCDNPGIHVVIFYQYCRFLFLFWHAGDDDGANVIPFFTSIVGFYFFSGMPVMMMAQTLFRSMDNFALVVVLFFILCGNIMTAALVVVLFFILCGNIMTAGSIVDKLIKVANAVVGFFPGGLAMAGVLACGMFGAISGSTVATVVAIGGFMIPALMENQYDEQFSVGIMTTSPILGVMFFDLLIFLL